MSEKIVYGTSKYRVLHLWVEAELGKPQKCEKCGSIDRKRYHWANISKEYRKDITDWMRLCPPCHVQFDKKDTCKRGHLRTVENTYYSPTSRNMCRTCKSNYGKIYRLTHKK